MLRGGGHSPTFKGLHTPSPAPKARRGGLFSLLWAVPLPLVSPPPILAPQLIPSRQEPGAENWPSAPTTPGELGSQPHLPGPQCQFFDSMLMAAPLGSSNPS